MAGVNALNQSYVIGPTNGTGWRPIDIYPKIVDQDPRKRPFFELSGEASARMVLHQWQVRGVRARAKSAILEGADFTFTAIAGPSRLDNTCQILTEGCEVSNTSIAEMAPYGVSSLWRDQIAHKSYLHGADIEHQLINSLVTAGNTDQARQMRGLRSWAQSVATANVLTQNGATLTEAQFILGIETGWNNSDMSVDTALIPSKQQKIIDNFNAEGATRYQDVTTRDIVHKVAVYHSSFGTVECHLCRDLSNTSTTGEIIMFAREMVKKAYLRKTKLYPVAQTSDGQRASMLTEMTLEVLNPEQLVYIYQLASPT